MSVQEWPNFVFDLCNVFDKIYTIPALHFQSCKWVVSFARGECTSIRKFLQKLRHFNVREGIKIELLNLMKTQNASIVGQLNISAFSNQRQNSKAYVKSGAITSLDDGGLRYFVQDLVQKKF